MAEGLRERKKRQTRQHLSDVATGLFLERGFDAVTIAEIAHAADVSVNTVYNYFPAKEDLFLDRGQGVVERLSRYVRGPRQGRVRRRRRPARAAHPGRERLAHRRPDGGGVRPLHAGHRGRRQLKARLWHIQQEAAEHLEATLLEVSGARPGDRVPVLVAGQLSWVHSTLMAHIGREMVAGRKPAEVSRDALALLDDIEDLLGEKVLNYARRAAE